MIFEMGKYLKNQMSFCDWISNFGDSRSDWKERGKRKTCMTVVYRR